ncbi:MAG: CoA transferase [Alphaproteobacteria bacterium]|nr:CoA transferase [Alphaproteobacteria bacterium]
MRQDILRGIRFADFTWAGAGPFSTKIFSDFGAEVIKIESVTRPDSVRTGGPFAGGRPGMDRSGYFASRNTGKQSLTLNLKSEEGRAIARDLIARADVVSNNFGPGAMERLGFSYDDVRAIRPDIVYLGMPMYGDDGPRAELLGVGMTISAVTGLMWLTGYGEGRSIGPGTHYPDHAANPYHAAFAVMAALRHRRRTGEGMKIDLAQVESTINMIGPSYVEYSGTGIEPAITGNRSRWHAPHNIFRCRGEDAWVAITVMADAQWPALCAALGLGALAAEPGLAGAAGRVAAVGRIEAAIARAVAERDGEELAAALQQAGVPAAPVQSARELIDRDPQLRARGYWQRIDHPEMGETGFTSPPYRFDGERVTLARPPLLGEHTDAVLRDTLGYPEERIAALREAGVLQ